MTPSLRQGLRARTVPGRSRLSQQQMAAVHPINHHPIKLLRFQRQVNHGQIRSRDGRKCYRSIDCTGPLPSNRTLPISPWSWLFVHITLAHDGFSFFDGFCWRTLPLAFYAHKGRPNYREEAESNICLGRLYVCPGDSASATLFAET